MLEPYDLIVLAGGSGERLGGADKARVVIGGRAMLARVLVTGRNAVRRIVVGPERPEFANVRWTREDPPGSGPLAGVAAGFAASSSPCVVVLATDLPLLEDSVVRRLRGGASRESGVAVLVDAAGQRQHLAAAYRRDVLARRLEEIGDPSNRPARLLLEGLEPVEIEDRGTSRDVDTPEDLETVMLIDWTRQLAEALGVADELDDLDIDAVLNLARDAAHSIERPAAPVTTFLVGYAAARAADGPERIADLLRTASALARQHGEGNEGDDN